MVLFLENYMSKSGIGLFKHTIGANRTLMDELAAQGEKFSPKKIVGITKDPSGKIVWIEEGNSKSGLEHIVNEQVKQFNGQGISTDYILEAVHQGKIDGTQGSGPRPRTVYEVIYEGEPHHIAVQISDNGYIVSANPKSMKGNK